MPCEFVEGEPLSEIQDSSTDSGTDGVGSTSEYGFRENINVPTDQTHTESVSDDETRGNKFIDNTKPGASTEISVDGDDAELGHTVTAGANESNEPQVTVGSSGSTGNETVTVTDTVLANDGTPEKPPANTGPDASVGFDSDAAYDVLDYSKINLNTFVSSPSVDGSAVEVLIPEGEHTGGNMNYNFERLPGGLPEEAWLQYDIYYGPEFYAEEAGKVGAGFAHLTGDGGTGGGDLADGTNGWSARQGFWRPRGSGDIRIGTYLYHAEMDGPYGDGHQWNGHGELSTGQWYRITQYCRMNSGGDRNGVYRGWVDGNLAFDKRDIKFRNEGYENKLRIGNVWIHTYYGGSPVPNHDIHVYYDNLKLARDRFDSSLESP